MPTQRISIFIVLAFILAACGLTPRQAPIPQQPPVPPTQIFTPSPLPPTPVMDTRSPSEIPPSPAPGIPIGGATASPTPRSATYLKLIRLTVISAKFTPIEISLETDGVYANPFDPDEVDLQLILDSPDGKHIRLPAFWSQDFDPGSAQPRGEPGWRARFTPSLVGAWTARAALTSPQAQLLSDPLTVQVGEDKANIAPGFIRLNPRNPRYFAFDDGTTFFPMGINMGWGGNDPLADYTRWLDRFSANGGTFIRVWMASWSFGLEWKDTGLGDYSQRLYRAWLLDRLFELSEERGVYIELVLLNHGAFSADINPEWADNPYNAANGGPCLHPQDFATDPTAQDLFKRRLRYIAARWAYSPALMAWEWWNEADLTPITAPQLSAWIKLMTPVLKDSDPYHHPISISYATSAVPEVANLPDIDFAQLHLYDSTDPAFNFPDLYQQWSKGIPNKPILSAEFGANAGGENQDSFDRAGLHLHNGLWAATFSGFASPAMYWWWDNYVDPLSLWGVFSGLSRFLRDEDMAALQPASVLLSSRNVPARSLGTSTRLLVWIHDRNNDLGSLQKALDGLFLEGKQAGREWIYHPDPLYGLTITVRDLKDGSYTAYWYSPTDASWLDQQALAVSGGTATFPIPTFTGDIALKFLPASEPAPDAP